MIQIKENQLDVQTYLSLRKKVNWKELSKEQAKKALDNSLLTICAFQDETPIGMARMVGDGAVICYVQDLIIVPEAQGQGVGSMLLEYIKKYAESLTEPGTQMMLDLMCAKGRESFYEKHGFIARPTKELGPGMICYLNAK
ncbi:MAG: GNAT family N-acetyltransferase [Lachnospiraceae bacterium]|nr:GNAT family N-acetyltransferase [Lachnospiraceae bacterium]